MTSLDQILLDLWDDTKWHQMTSDDIRWYHICYSYRNIETLDVDILEYWGIGILKYWNIKILAFWDMEKIMYRNIEITEWKNQDIKM